MITKLNEIISVLESGSRPKGGVKEGREGIPSLGGEHLSKEGGFNFSKLKMISHDFFSKMKRGKIEIGDILIVKDGATTGKVAIVREDFPFKDAAINEHLFRIRVDSDKAVQEYIFRYLQSPLGQLQILSSFRGAAIGGINTSFVDRVSLDLPSIDEQKRIATILDKADEITSASKQATGLYDKFIDSVYNEFSENSESIRMTIQQLLDQEFITLHKDGNHGSEYPRKSEFGEEGIPFLMANCFDDSGNFIPSKVKLLNPQKAIRLKHGRILKNDVLLAHNATVGRVALYDGRFESAMIGTSLTCFRCNDMKLNPYFLFTAFRSRDFQMQLKKNMGQSTRNQVPITSQRKLSINIPKISVQNLIASLVENANDSFDSIANQDDLIIQLNESSSQQIIHYQSLRSY